MHDYVLTEAAEKRYGSLSADTAGQESILVEEVVVEHIPILSDGVAKEDDVGAVSIGVGLCIGVIGNPLNERLACTESEMYGVPR